MHTIMFWFTRNLCLRFLLTWLVLLVVFAEACYRFCEVPMRDKGRTLARKMLSRAQEDVREVDLKTGTLGPPRVKG
ncbi:hypothetical protein D3C85_1834270 [compost metagenome]